MLFTPTGHKVEPRAPLPTTDLKLADGRVLRLMGKAPVVPGALAWRTENRLAAPAGVEETPHGRLLHVSMSYSSRDPSWDDIKAVRAAFYPADVDVMMVLPKAEDYVNVHHHTFHLWQTPVAWDVR